MQRTGSGQGARRTEDWLGSAGVFSCDLVGYSGFASWK